MKKIINEQLLSFWEKPDEKELIDPEKDNRGNGDILPKKQPEQGAQGKKILLND